MPKIIAETEVQVVKTKSSLNREAWLTEVTKFVHPLFSGWNMGKYRVTCGWPCKNGLGKRVRRVGECHPSESSKGGVHEMFISPMVGDSIQAAGIVCHEMAHIAATVGSGHKGEYIKVCKHVGLTKNKPTQAAPGDKLEERLKKFIDIKIGIYPHEAMDPILKEVEKKKTSVKLECECGCRVVMQLKWYQSVGAPTCACGGVMEEKEAEGE
jgi:hypothetical protein